MWLIFLDRYKPSHWHLKKITRIVTFSKIGRDDFQVHRILMNCTFVDPLHYIVYKHPLFHIVCFLQDFRRFWTIIEGWFKSVKKEISIGRIELQIHSPNIEWFTKSNMRLECNRFAFRKMQINSKMSADVHVL